jgi:hypothetical protein
MGGNGEEKEIVTRVLLSQYPYNILHGSALSYTVKVEAVLRSETSVNIYQTTRHHIPVAAVRTLSLK